MEWTRNKYAVAAAAGIAAFLLVWQIFFGLSPSAIKVIDVRVTFKFTAYQEKEQYFISYSLENKKKTKMKATVRIQLGKSGLGGRIFKSLKAQNDTALLEPLETRAFVVELDVPKPKKGQERELDVRAKIIHVSRA